MFSAISRLFVYGTVGTVGYAYLRRHPESFAWKIGGAFMRRIDPEEAHNLFIKMASYGLLPYDVHMLHHDHDETSLDILKIRVWDLDFSSPIGLAAGLDKDAKAIDGLHMLGFGFVEVGTITPKPQEGNPKPRVFRLPFDRAIINRYGFNSEGLSAAVSRLTEQRQMLKKRQEEKMGSSWWGFVYTFLFPSSAFKHAIIGVNIGKNKDSTSMEESLADYEGGVSAFGELADYLAINISSPNTPGLRALQRQAELTKLIQRAKETRDNLNISRKPPILVKISPDLTDEEMRDIAEVATNMGIDGIIISNTTTSRPDTLRSPEIKTQQQGGLSGAPLKPLALATLRAMYKYTNGMIPLIGVGGIENAQDAYERIRSGASLVQLYTSLVYNGPDHIVKMKRELAELLQRDGFATVKDAVGADHRQA